jgi:hypothetical protein
VCRIAPAPEACTEFLRLDGVRSFSLFQILQY